MVLFKPLTSDQTTCVGVIQTIRQDSNHTGNPVVLFRPLNSDQTICVGVIQTIRQDLNHTPNPPSFIQTISVCLKPLGGLTQTIPTKILYHSVCWQNEVPTRHHRGTLINLLALCHTSRSAVDRSGDWERKKGGDRDIFILHRFDMILPAGQSLLSSFCSVHFKISPFLSRWDLRCRHQWCPVAQLLAFKHEYVLKQLALLSCSRHN